MPRLDDFLCLTPAAAADQWRAILSRRPKPRQDVFVPVETLLAAGLFYLLRPNRYGGGNIHSAPKPVHQLAATCKRTPGSFTNKMLNLDGSRPHGQAVEPRLFMALHGNPGLLADLYRVVLVAAREVGLGDEDVPDFLGLLDSQTALFPLETLDAPPDVDGERAARMADGYQLPLFEAEQVVRARSRLERHRYASVVLDAWSHTCAFCGLRPRHVSASTLLKAARVKPAPHATAAELRDTSNAVAACPTHGLAFQHGWLGIGEDRSVLVSPNLALDLRDDPGMARAFGSGVLLRQLDHQPSLNRACLEWHAAELYGAESH